MSIRRGENSMRAMSFSFRNTFSHILCDYVKSLWSDLVQCLQNGLILQLEHYRLTFLGFLISQANKVFINHILLIFKLYVFKSREKKFKNISNLIAEICNLFLLA